MYDVSVRLNLATGGFGAGIALVLRQFQSVQAEAGRTQTAVERALSSRTSSYTAMERATNSLQMSQNRYNSALQDHLRTSSTYGAASDEASRSLDRLKNAHLSLANAQLTQTQVANRAATAQAEYASASAAAVAALERQDRATRGMNQLALGGLMTGGGLMIWNVLGGGIQKAISLDMIQNNIGQALTDSSGRRLSPSARQATLDRLSSTEISLGESHQMSQIEAAQLVQAAVNSGMTQPGVLLGTKNRAGILGGLADFAEVLKLRRGYSPEQSATVASEFAHLFGAWNPSQFNVLTGTLGRALAISPSSSEQFLQLTSQYTSVMREAYGSKRPNDVIRDAITTAALMSELGQSQRGGTQFAALLARSAGGGRISAAGRTALQKMQRDAGFTFFDPKTGAFTSAANALTGIYASSLHETPKQFINEMTAAFGQVGNRIAGAIANPSSQNRLQVLQTMLGPNGLMSLVQMQQGANATPQGQLNQLNADLQTLDTIVGTQLVPAMAPFIHDLAMGAQTLVDFAKAHPMIVRLTGDFAALSGTLLVVVGPLVAIAGAINILAAGTQNVWAFVNGVKTVVPPLLALASGLGAAGLATVVGLIGSFGVSLYALIKTVGWIIDWFKAGGAPDVGATVKVGKTTYVRDTVVGDPRYGTWVPSTYHPYDYRHMIRPGSQHAGVPQPPGHTQPGVGGGGRIVVNMGGLHFHGWDPEHHKSFIEDAKQHVTDALADHLDQFNYYASMMLPAGTHVGRGGY